MPAAHQESLFDLPDPEPSEPEEEGTVCHDYSHGIKTGRDAYLYDFDRGALKRRMQAMCATYEATRISQPPARDILERAWRILRRCHGAQVRGGIPEAWLRDLAWAENHIQQCAAAIDGTPSDTLRLLPDLMREWWADGRYEQEMAAEEAERS